ncbi:MAG: 7-cyano-7-deazaguanine synthase QueC [Lachnospiraceae bacterium]
MKVMVLFSGGVDSTTCLALAIQQFGRDQVIPLSILYGQKHHKEMEAAKQILDYYGIIGTELDLSLIFASSKCSLLSHSGENIPQESYASQISQTGGNPVSTYVPFRNGLFLSAAASMALSLECRQVWYGAHRDDAAGNAYPDCSETFFNGMKLAVCEGTGGQLELIAPFISHNKAEVIRQGLQLNVPYQYTWSCYEGSETACGKCGTCIDRRLAFDHNHTTDPISYSSDAPALAHSDNMEVFTHA